MHGGLCHRFALRRQQRPLKLESDGVPCDPLILDLGRYAVRLEEVQHLLKASTWEPNVLRKVLGTGDYAWLPVGGETHRLRLIELRVLERRQPPETIQHGCRQILLLNVGQV